VWLFWQLHMTKEAHGRIGLKLPGSTNENLLGVYMKQLDV